MKTISGPINEANSVLYLSNKNITLANLPTKEMTLHHNRLMDLWLQHVVIASDRLQVVRSINMPSLIR
jgi:hypothetical protein